MDADLLPEASYDDLPAESDRRFVQLAVIAQANLIALLREHDELRDNGEFAWECRRQFMDLMQALAEELAVSGLPHAQDADNNFDEHYRHFISKLNGIVARVRARYAGVRSSEESVQLGYRSKAWLRQEVEQLRGAIEAADLPEKKRAALLDKLAELLAELEKERLSFARTMAILASLATIGAGTTTAAVNSPKIWHLISRVISHVGEDHDKESAERFRLAGPAPVAPSVQFEVPDYKFSTSRALMCRSPDVRYGQPNRQASRGHADDLDDDVPF